MRQITATRHVQHGEKQTAAARIEFEFDRTDLLDLRTVRSEWDRRRTTHVNLKVHWIWNKEDVSGDLWKASRVFLVRFANSMPRTGWITDGQLDLAADPLPAPSVGLEFSKTPSHRLRWQILTNGDLA
jgi:hypothetical protein